MQQLRDRLAANLLTAREQAGLPLEELAQRCELEPAEVAAIERGEELPAIDTAVRLAAALGVGIEQLMAGIAWDPEAQRFVIAA